MMKEFDVQQKSSYVPAKYLGGYRFNQKKTARKSSEAKYITEDFSLKPRP